MLKDQGIDFLISRFEGGGLLSQPTLRDLNSSFSVRATLQWMDLLLAVLDCYNTFISLRIIKPQHILSESKCSDAAIKHLVPLSAFHYQVKITVVVISCRLPSSLPRLERQVQLSQSAAFLSD